MRRPVRCQCVGPTIPDSVKCVTSDGAVQASAADLTMKWMLAEVVKALIVANAFLETELEKLRAAVSMGYARGKLFEEAKTLPRDRKDWYD